MADKNDLSVFTNIYHHYKHRKQRPESYSGEGSTMAQTAVIREEIPALLRKVGAKVLLDAPCGDFNWMSVVDLPVDKYIGADIVKEIIEEDTAKYASPSREFIHRDLSADPLPKADVIFCRDCLVHLPFTIVAQVLGNFKKSGSTYLIATTFTDRTENVDIHPGGWRTLNMALPPVNLGEPLFLINEKCPVEGYGDKCLGLWKIN